MNMQCKRLAATAATAALLVSVLPQLAVPASAAQDLATERLNDQAFATQRLVKALPEADRAGFSTISVTEAGGIEIRWKGNDNGELVRRLVRYGLRDRVAILPAKYNKDELDSATRAAADSTSSRTWIGDSPIPAGEIILAGPKTDGSDLLVKFDGSPFGKVETSNSGHDIAALKDSVSTWTRPHTPSGTAASGSPREVVDTAIRAPAFW